MSNGTGLRVVPLATRFARFRLDLALALAALANRAYSVALVVYVYNATQSTAWVAAAAAARYLPGIATSALAQPVLERFSPRDVLVWADVSSALAMVAMATAIMLDASPAVPILLAAVVRIAASGQVPAASRLVPTVAGGRDLSHVAARQAATDKLMLLAGPAIGGVLLLAVRPDVEILALAALVAVAAAISRGLASPGAVRPRSPRLDADATPSLAAARATVGIFVAVIALSGFIYGTDTVLLAQFAKARLQLGDAGYGELFAGLGAGGILVAPLVNRLARQHRLAGWLALGMAAYGLPSVLIAHSHSAFQVVLLEALRGAGSITIDVIALTELQRIVLPQGIPRLTARLTSTVFGAVAVGALTTPLLLHALRTTGTFTLLGVIPPAFALVAYPMLRRCDVRTTRRYAELGGRVEVLERLGLLEATSRPVLERLAADVAELELPAGVTVIVERDPADAFYVVISGDLDVSVGGEHVNDLHAGDWFGEIGLLEELPRTATVRTVAPSILYRIGGNAFLDAFAQLPPSPSLLDSVAARLATGRPEVGVPVQS